MRQIIFYILLSCFLICSGTNIETSFGTNINVCNELDSVMNDSTHIESSQKIQWDRLGLHTGMFVGGGLTMLIVLEWLPENVTAWNTSERKNTPLFTRYKNNIKAGPVIDKDRFVFNYILHPYAGAVYYNAARGAGCNWWQSFIYCVFVSNVLWEYGIEAFNEKPSLQDLIITPCVGSLIGEGFHVAKKKILMRNYDVMGSRFFGKTLCWIIDPFNEFGNVILNKKDVLTSNIMYHKKGITLNLTYKF